MRAAFGFAGLLLFIPVDAIRYGGWVDVAGFIMAVVLIGREFMAVRALRQAA